MEHTLKSAMAAIRNL